ncbi:uncharacterized protein Osi3 [Anabrus simplex]|uniref:uncharacterized protein Osi3 n=1 Tax=Anabrus simplex TaxID=316456 RepID=UPI0035A344CA
MLRNSLKFVLVFLLALRAQCGPLSAESPTVSDVRIKEVSQEEGKIPVIVISSGEQPVLEVKKEDNGASVVPKTEEKVTVEKISEAQVMQDVKKEENEGSVVPKIEEKVTVEKISEAPVMKDEGAEKDKVTSPEPERVARNMDNDDNEANNNIQTPSEREAALIQKLNTKCSAREISSCIMLKMVTYMNKLLKKASIQVADGLEIRQTSAVVEEFREVTGRGIGDEDEEDGVTDLSQFITDKLWAFVRSRSLRWSVFPEADVVLSASPDDEGTLNLGMSIKAGRALGTGKRTRKKNNFGPLLAAAIMKLGLIGGIAFKALALLVGKALILSKIAFLLGAILWLKKLFSQQRYVSYEVIAHPHHSHSHTSSEHHPMDSYSAGWGRNLGLTDEAAHAMAYKAHAPTTKA